jgi:hypothetical protein
MTAVGWLADAPRTQGEHLVVRTTGNVAHVTFLPERRVTWRLTWGPHGPIEKVVEVDAQLFLRARYEYDAAGHLARKVAEGPGLELEREPRIATPLVFTYRTDAQGRVVERRSPLRQPSWRAPAEERLTVTYAGARATVRIEHAGRVVRIDELDEQGRVLATRLEGTPPARTLQLEYVRDAQGRLERVERVVEGRRTVADPRARHASITRFDVELVARAPVERREALWLLGAPVTASDEGRGIERTRTDDWSDECRIGGESMINAISGMAWDASGLSLGSAQGCICGFCVDAELAVDAPDELGVDLHWTRGPWVRLDDAIDLTTDHEVLTPTGLRPAGALRPGDAVIDASGGVRVLRTVEHLGEQERLGRNVRTASGTFVVGGIVVASEAPRPCR